MGDVEPWTSGLLSLFSLFGRLFVVFFGGSLPLQKNRESSVTIFTTVIFNNLWRDLVADSLERISPIQEQRDSEQSWSAGTRWQKEFMYRRWGSNNARHKSRKPRVISAMLITIVKIYQTSHTVFRHMVSHKDCKQREIDVHS